MTLTEQLALETPWHYRTLYSDAMGQFIKSHIAEIDKALEDGYSWIQIKNAARAVQSESSELTELWTCDAFRRRYKQIKKEAKS